MAPADAMWLGAAWVGLCAGLSWLDIQLAYVGIFSLVFLAVRTLLVPALSTAFAADYRDGKGLLATTESKLLWCNTAVSLVHSCLSSALSLAVLAVVPIHDWVHSCTFMATLCLSLSTGYFIYDFYDMVVGDLHRRAVGILLHHIMVTICYVLSIYYRVGVPYLVVMLLLEINSICLHLRKLMAMVGFTLTDRVYVVVWQALWLTFYTTRMLLTAGVHFAVFLDRAHFPETFQFATAFTGLTVLHVLNYLVYQGCTKAYRKETAYLKKL
ncbi:Aste57867_15380 [Aphanomyces stellatus]|uniref:Aste57867_15380 protein n=1 Tax=Aphanomyces stellatus TaxID=120398 RepID=A0A485L399_9STRA|nr:hypothetical protein As57867_015324 [Aphanomyces stellatus]VFT92186.1 Aste57867_15380 [Aphanomyces stellatus]